MKRAIVGTPKRPSKILLASTSLPVALLIAKGLMSSGTAPGWSQNSDLDVPTGQTRPSSAQPGNPVFPSAFSTSPVGSTPLDSQVPVPLPAGDGLAPVPLPASEVFTPVGNDPSNLPDAPTGQFSPSGAVLLPVDAPPAQGAATADIDTSLGVSSPLYYTPLNDGGGFGRSVFTPAYLPSYNPSAPNPGRYNLRVGPLKARLYGNAVFEYNDNINLGDHGNRLSDFSITPTAGVGISWIPASGKQSVELNVGVGYRWYLRHSELNSVIITPNTRAQYNFGIGKVKFNIHDSLTTAVDPITQGQIGVTTVSPNSLLNYRRIINTVGIRGDWEASSKIGVGAGYDFLVDRTLSDQFKALDHDEHTFSGGIYTRPTPRLQVGLAGTYTIINYSQNLQNSGTVWTLGPNARFQVTPTLSVQGSVGYTASSFDAPTATSNQDTSNFRSVSYEAGIRHQFLKRWEHSLAITRGASLGVDSNFADYTALSYNIGGQLTDRLGLGGQLRWEDFKVSGSGGQHANRYLLYLGVRYLLSQSWNSGLGYSYALNESNQLGLDYYQNRVILDITYQF